MCAGGNVSPRNPTHINAYLKYRAGWSQSVTNITAGLNATLVAGENKFYIHRKGQTEYFIIENRHKSGRDGSLPDSGLAIWHVDELGDNENQHMTASLHYECSLVQADGRFDLENGNGQGDAFDLFGAGVNDHFGVNTNAQAPAALRKHLGVRPPDHLWAESQMRIVRT